MKIRTTFEEMQEVLKTATLILAESNLDSSMKNITFWVKRDRVTSETSVTIACLTVYTSTYNKISANVEFLEDEKDEEYFIQLQAKTLINTFKTFSSLTRTKVEWVEFEINEKNVILRIQEKGKEETDNFANNTKFQFVKVPLKPSISDKIKLYDVDLELSEIEVAELNYYFDAALPLLVNDITRRWNNSLIFNKEKIFTIASYGGLIFNNTLAEKGFEDFVLKYDTIKLIKQFISSLEKFKFGKKLDIGNENIYLLVFENNKTKVVERVGKPDERFRYELLGDIPTNGIVVDKNYLYDVVKRLVLTPENVNIEITITDGKGSMMIECNEFVQNVPIIMSKGSGDFKFTVMPEIFSKSVMRHWKYNKDINELFLLVMHKENKEIALCIMDKTNRWYMILPKLSLSVEFKKF